MYESLACATIAHVALDRIRHGRRFLMLPESERQPTCRREFAVVAPITFEVRLQLLHPPLPIGMRRSAVLWAGMPEAPVEEHRDPFLRKDQVRTGSRHTRNGPIHPEAETASMQPSSHLHLEGCIPSRCVVHPAGNRCRAGAGWSVDRHRFSDIGIHRRNGDTSPPMAESAAPYPNGIGTASPIHLASLVRDGGRCGSVTKR